MYLGTLPYNATYTSRNETCSRITLRSRSDTSLRSQYHLVSVAKAGALNPVIITVFNDDYIGTTKFIVVRSTHFCVHRGIHNSRGWHLRVRIGTFLKAHGA